MNSPMTFVNAIPLIVMASGVSFGAFIVPWVTKTFHPYIKHLAAVILVLALVVILLASLGILTFRRIGTYHPEKYAYRYLGVVGFFTRILYPFTMCVTFIAKLAARPFGVAFNQAEEPVTEEEIIMMVSEGHEQGVIEASEAEMISNIFKFDDKEVSDIMTHRRHICAVDCSLSLSEAAEIMARERYSRYPVFENDTDNIIGILHLKDVMRLLVSGETDTSIKEVMRKPVFVPDTQNINSLFREMQAKKMHMAIVVDEYGQSCGLVAMEDILEEIVGNILDEYDPDEDNIQIIGGAYLMKGLTPLEDITRTLGITFDDDFETLNGLLISKLEHIPQNNEFASVDIDGYTFKVMSVKDNAISLVKVTKITG